MTNQEGSKWDQVVHGIESRTNLCITDLCDMDISTLREHFDAKFSKPLSYYSAFPVIGRGSALRDALIGTDALNREVDEILSHG